MELFNISLENCKRSFVHQAFLSYFLCFQQPKKAYGLTLQLVLVSSWKVQLHNPRPVRSECSVRSHEHSFLACAPLLAYCVASSVSH